MPQGPASILHLFVGSVPGGVLKYVIDLADAARARGTAVLLAGQRGDWHHLVQERRLPWLEIPIRGGVLDVWRSAGMVARELRGSPVHLIHAHHRRATLAGRILQYRLRRELGDHHVPALLYTLHMPGIPLGFPWRLLTDFGDHAHVPSQRARRWLLQTGWVAPERISVIPHGVRVEAFPQATAESRHAARRQYGLPAEMPLAVFLGRLEDPKNPEWAVAVAAAARGRGMTLHVAIAGEGPDAPALRHRIEREGLQDRVHLLGTVPAAALLPAADLLLLPSRTEGFSYAAAEAMSCGIPVLRTQTGGCEEMIIEGVTGRSVPVDQQAFVQVALEMLARPELLPAMGQAAAGHVRKHLSFDRQVEQTLELYRRLATERPR